MSYKYEVVADVIVELTYLVEATSIEDAFRQVKTEVEDMELIRSHQVTSPNPIAASKVAEMKP